MGKRLKDIYPHATRWQVFKYKVRTFFRKLFILGAFIGIIALAFQIGRYAFPLTEDAPTGPTIEQKLKQ
jgi:hypothetical protein